MTRDQVMMRLSEVFRKVFEDEGLALDATTTASDVKGWDSLRMVVLVLAVEKAFGVRLRSREVDRLACVGDFVELLHAKTEAA